MKKWMLYVACGLLALPALGQETNDVTETVEEIVFPDPEEEEEMPIARISTRTRNVEIYSNDEELLFTIYDKEGKRLARRVPIEKLEKAHPKLFKLLTKALAIPSKKNNSANGLQFE